MAHPKIHLTPIPLVAAVLALLSKRFATIRAMLVLALAIGSSAGMSPSARAQESIDIRHRYSDVVAMRVVPDQATVFAREGGGPSSALLQLERGTHVLAAKVSPDYFAVADSEGQLIGFVAAADLTAGDRIRPTAKPAGVFGPAPAPDPEIAQYIRTKDPHLATLLSFLLAGGGQLYSGAHNKGMVLLLGAVVAPIVGYKNSTAPDTRCGLEQTYISNVGPPEYSMICRSIAGDYKPLYIGIGVGASLWLYGLATASGDAMKFNRRVEMAAGPASFSLAVRF